MKSASDVVLFVMQISIGGQNVAPLEVTKDDNSIILAKQFVVKHLLPSDQIMLLSTKIDDIRNQLLAQQENINSNSPKNHQTITTPLNHTKNPLVQISSKILSKSHNIQHSQNEQLQNIRDEFAAFYTKHSQQNDDSQSTKSLQKPFKINVKIQNKRTNRIINEDTTKCEISRKGKSKLIKPIKSMSKAATPRIIKKKQNKKRRSSLRSNSVKPRRKDWWNKLHDDANKYHSKIIKEQKIAKATKRRKEIRECTFKPQISEPARTLKRDGSKIWKRIVDPLGENKGSRLRQLRQRKKIKDKEKYKKECTFKPYISDKSQQIMEDKKLDVIIETNDENTGNVFNRLHLSPKSRKLTLHECCSPKKTETEQKRSRSHSLSQQQPRYLLLHQLSYKYSKKRGETKFHPDEDITFKPRILNNKHIPVLRKAVTNVSDHLYNAHTSSSTQHKVSTTPKIKRIDTIKVSHETEKLLSKMYKKQANELYFKLCGNIESELLSVPFDRILNETLFNNMNKLESMIIKRIEKFCSRKSKMVLRKNQFVTLFTKLQPKCKNKLLCHV